MIEIKIEADPLDVFFDERRLIDAADEAARQLMRRKGLRQGGNLVGATEAANEAAAKELDKQTRSGRAGFTAK